MIHRLVRPRGGNARNESIWLTIYADLITTLMLVFLALYGLTIMGSDALAKAMQSMKLGEMDIFSRTDAALDFEEIVPIIKEQFKFLPDITVSDEASLARISFGEKVLYESGGSELKPSGITALMELASILVAVSYTVVVEGHTDDVPLRPGSRYKDNRELSLARAMSVVDLLVHQGALPRDQFATAAYGEYRPRSSNLTVSGRQMNRRVEIILVKDFPYNPVIQQEAAP